jgi:hypothetical protein
MTVRSVVPRRVDGVLPRDRRRWVLFVSVVVLALYSLTFLGIFFNVALAAATDSVLDGREASFGAAVSVASSRLGCIAGWAALGLVVGVGIAVGVVAGVVRQVFAVSLYRASAA